MTKLNPVDVSVTSSVDTGVIEVSLCSQDLTVQVPMDYTSALTLRGMLTDALDHQDKGGHANPAIPLPWDRMSSRLKTVLRRDFINGYTPTYGDLVKLSVPDLLDIRGFGPGCLEEVSKLLTDAGFDAPEWPEDQTHWGTRDPR